MEADLLFEDEDGNAVCEGCLMEDMTTVMSWGGEEVEVIPKFDQTAFVPREDHVPDCTLIDLDYPMYGTVVVKCGGRKYDLRVVHKALALVDELHRKENA